ncbi:sensory neuron membrane protein 1-like [Macrosteles quadrilineatus]|uniref:sensory neuron membrane protein 1-like n=1 Tax=Macrosteles quadrilineatus TaxID=74068 RepID=UPI0023E164E6|nr:sensory neuron membrane protein 1-like [Macrosteles quadrilineatus]
MPISPLLHPSRLDPSLQFEQIFLVDRWKKGGVESLFCKNGSVDGSQYTVRRGAEEATDVGRLVAVNGRPTLNYWRGDCNILNGTDGSIFPPFRRPDNRSLVAYSGEVCRVVHGVYEGEHDVNRVSGYAYTVTLGDTENEPQDKCYCAAVDRCYKKGTLDAYRCQGAPLVASLPHFYGGSQDYITGVSGIQPNKEKHEILVVLEPTTGIPLSVKKRIQMNIDLKPIRYTPRTQNFHRTLVPLFWAEELFELNGELLELLEASLLRPVKVVHFGRWILVIFGVVLLLFSIIIKTKQIRRNSKLDPSKNFDYGPEFKEKLQSLDSEETVTSGPFFISQPPAIGLPQPRWGKTKNTAETLVSGGLVRTTAVGGVKTVKYKRISGLQEILVKEQERNQ